MSDDALRRSLVELLRDFAARQARERGVESVEARKQLAAINGAVRVILMAMNPFQTLRPGEKVIWSGTLEKSRHDRAVKPAPQIAAGPKPRPHDGSNRNHGNRWGRFGAEVARELAKARTTGDDVPLKVVEHGLTGKLALQSLRERACAKRMIRRALGAGGPVSGSLDL